MGNRSGMFLTQPWLLLRHWLQAEGVHFASFFPFYTVCAVTLSGAETAFCVLEYSPCAVRPGQGPSCYCRSCIKTWEASDEGLFVSWCLRAGCSKLSVRGETTSTRWSLAT